MTMPRMPCMRQRLANVAERGPQSSGFQNRRERRPGHASKRLPSVQRERGSASAAVGLFISFAQDPSGDFPAF